MHPADLAVWKESRERGGTTYRRAFLAPCAITIFLHLMLTNGQRAPVVDYRGAETPASHPSAVFPWHCLHHGRGHILHRYYLHPLCPLPLSLSSSVSFWCQCYWCSVISSKTNLLLPPSLNYAPPPSSFLTLFFQISSQLQFFFPFFCFFFKATRASEFSTRDSSFKYAPAAFLSKGMWSESRQGGL